MFIMFGRKNSGNKSIISKKLSLLIFISTCGFFDIFSSASQNIPISTKQPNVSSRSNTTIFNGFFVSGISLIEGENKKLNLYNT